ncbi:XK-related protein 7-like [Lineus longissimus]|uniref:XK-related protein 7-like n=1 Tax=Lineus longissimus TaxID=88925 RepID=UPI00315D7A4B
MSSYKSDILNYISSLNDASQASSNISFWRRYSCLSVSQSSWGGSISTRLSGSVDGGTQRSISDEQASGGNEHSSAGSLHTNQRRYVSWSFNAARTFLGLVIKEGEDMESLSKFFLKKEPCLKNTSIVLRALRDPEQPASKTVFDEVDGEDHSHINASGLQIFLQICFALMCIGDTGSDIFTAYLYSKGHEFWFFWLTLIIVIVASLFIIAINTYCYYQEYITLEKYQSKQDGQPLCIWFVRILCSLLFIGPFLRYLESAWYYIQVRRAGNRFDRMYYLARIKATRSTIAILNLVESFTEAAPQLALQLYILLNQGQQSWLRLIVQTVSCSFSWMSCTNALVSQARVYRLSQEPETNSKSAPLSYLDLFLIFVWRFLMIGPRILAFSLLASVVRYFVVLSVILFHWILGTIYAVSRRFPRENLSVAEIPFSFVIGFVFIFTDWNTTNGYKRWPYITYYVIVFVENVSMVVVWFVLTPNSHEWYHLPALVFIIVGFGLGVLFMIFYYVGLKPRHLNCCKRKPASDKRGNVQYSLANNVEMT